MRRSVLFVALSCLLSGILSANAGLAQNETKTGRHRPAAREQADTGRKKTSSTFRSSRWEFQINGGLLKGGDLFRATNSTGEPVAWVPSGQGDWLSHRVRAHLEGAFSTGLQVQRRMGDWYSLRAGFSYAKADIVVEAPIEEWAEVFSYDSAEIWLFSLGSEIRLTTSTPSYPYVAADVVIVGFDPQNSGFLAQTNLGGRVALGFHHQFDPIWSFSVEAGVSRTAFSSGEFPVPTDIEPGDLEYESETQMTLFEAKFAIGVKI